MITIIHKSNCSTSLGVLALLKSSGKKFKVRDYIQQPLSAKEIEDLTEKLQIKPSLLVRKKEPVYKENFSDKPYSEKQWIKILEHNPILLERPILLRKSRGVIAKPIEVAEKFIK